MRLIWANILNPCLQLRSFTYVMRLLDDLIMFVFPGDVIDRCLLEIRPQQMFPEHLECPDCCGEDINRQTDRRRFLRVCSQCNNRNANINAGWQGRKQSWLKWWLSPSAALSVSQIDRNPLADCGAEIIFRAMRLDPEKDNFFCGHGGHVPGHWSLRRTKENPCREI